MALATTTASSAIGATDTSIVVASATSFSAGRLVLVDQEVMVVASSYASGTTIPVLRGKNGSWSAAHKVTANVTHGLPSDFSDPQPGQQMAVTYTTLRPVLVQSISATATLALPPAGVDTRLILNGTSVITLTVPVPTKDMDGNVLEIIGNGAAAHLLTFTGGVGGAGSSYDIITVNATAPTAFRFVACNGLWLTFCAPAMGGTVTNLIGSIA